MTGNANVRITKMSTKGQVVIPEDTRQDLRLEPGAMFAVYGDRNADSILLKRVRVEDPVRTFERLAKHFSKRAKELDLNTSPHAIAERVRAYRKNRA